VINKFQMFLSINGFLGSQVISFFDICKFRFAKILSEERKLRRKRSDKMTKDSSIGSQEIK